MTAPDAKDSSHSKRQYALVVAVLFIAALLHVYVWRISVPKPDGGKRDWTAIRFHDESSYYLHTADAVANEGLTYLKKEESLRSPPMPWAWLLVWGRNILLTRISNIGLVLLGAFLVGLVGRQYGAQILTTLFAATGYQIAYYSGSVLTEPLAFFFVCVALWAVDIAVQQRRWWAVVIAGVAMAFAAYSRPSLQPWPVLLIALIILGVFWRRWIKREQKDAQSSANEIAAQTEKVQKDSNQRLRSFRTNRFGLATACIILFVHVAVLAPWLIKNKLQFGVARVANGLGAVVFLGSELKTNADEPGFSGMEWPNLPVQGPNDHMSLEGEARLKKAAIEKIKSHPWEWTKIGFVKIGRFLIGGPKWHFQPGRTLSESKAWIGPSRGLVRYVWWTISGTFVTVFGLAGLLVLLRNGNAAAIAGVALILTLVAVHFVTYSMPRFAVPILPALALGAGYGFRRFGLMAYLSLGAVSVGIILAITFWHEGTALREIPANRIDHFKIVRSVDFDSSNSAENYSIGCDDLRPSFNTCVFVSATIEPKAQSWEKVTGVLQLESHDTKADSIPDLQFDMIADGRERHYLICVQHEPNWRSVKWEEIRFHLKDGADHRIRLLSIKIGH